MNIILNLCFITICIACLNWILINNRTFIKKIGISTLFVGFHLLIFRLIFPISIPFPIRLTLPYPSLLHPLEAFFARELYIWSLSEFLIFCWLSVALLLIGRLIYKYIELIKFRIFLMQTTIANEKLLKQFVTIKQEIGVKQNIIFLISNHVQQPLMFGILKPIIVLPNRAYTDSELLFILKHEIYHVKNKDSFWKICFCLFKAIYWWLPTVHIIYNQLHEYVEIICDNSCLKTATYQEKTEYLACLLNEAKYFSNTTKHLLFASSITTSSSILEKRFYIILSDVEEYSIIKKVIKAIIIFIFLLSFSIILLPPIH